MDARGRIWGFAFFGLVGSFWLALLLASIAAGLVGLVLEWGVFHAISTAAATWTRCSPPSA